jgi:excisionase family DNA binding protein
MDDLLTTKQLMSLLHLDRTTIYRMLNEGRLPAMRVGGQWRFERQAIDRWLEQNNCKLTESNPPSETVSALPTEVLPVYCIQPIQQVFAETSDVGAVTTDLDGKPVIPVSNSCAFCDLILAAPAGRARCEASWRKLADQGDAPPRLEKCHAGLTYARGRIVVQGQFIAMFFVGQFVLDDPDRKQAKARVAELAQSCGIESEKLTRAADQVQALTKARGERLLHLIQLVADTYSHIGQERLDLMTRLKKVAEIAGAAKR